MWLGTYCDSFATSIIKTVSSGASEPMIAASRSSWSPKTTASRALFGWGGRCFTDREEERGIFANCRVHDVASWQQKFLAFQRFVLVAQQQAAMPIAQKRVNPDNKYRELEAASQRSRVKLLGVRRWIRVHELDAIGLHMRFGKAVVCAPVPRWQVNKQPVRRRRCG